MHQNTFLTTPQGHKNHFWRNISGGLEMCGNACKHVFKHSRRSKISFLKKSFWWSGRMRKCIKTRFLPLQTVKNIFFQFIFLVIWKYAKKHQNTFLTTPDVQKHLFWKKDFAGPEVCANASKHLLTTTDVPKYLFWKKVFGGLEVCANASKHVFNHSRQ